MQRVRFRTGRVVPLSLSFSLSLPLKVAITVTLLLASATQLFAALQVRHCHPSEALLLGAAAAGPLLLLAHPFSHMHYTMRAVTTHHPALVAERAP